MKTIKELEAKEPIHREDSGYQQALKDVLGLIDEFMYDWKGDRVGDTLEELKARING